MIESTSDPATTDDSAALSVQKGTFWRNTTSGEIFICTSPANDAAVWKKLVGSGASQTMTNVQAAATTLTPTTAQSGSRFIVTNAAAVAITLPAVAEGLIYEFVRAADEEMVVASAAGDDMIAGNDLAADSVTFTTASQHIGAIVRVEGILVGTTAKWLVTIPQAPFSTGAPLTLGIAT